MKSFIVPSAAVNADVAPFCSENVFDEQTVKIINAVAHQLVKNGCFPSHSEDDVALQLALVIHSETPKYRQEKGDFHAFVRSVLTHRAKNLIRDWNKKHTDIVSLDITVTEDGETMGDMISDDYFQISTGNRVRSETERQDLIDSENYAISQLPVKSQVICKAILAGESISSLARQYGISRTAFRKTYLSPIRKVFLRLGLDEFAGRA